MEMINFVINNAWLIPLMPAIAFVMIASFSATSTAPQRRVFDNLYFQLLPDGSSCGSWPVG